MKPVVNLNRKIQSEDDRQQSGTGKQQLAVRREHLRSLSDAERSQSSVKGSSIIVCNASRNPGTN